MTGNNSKDKRKATIQKANAYEEVNQCFIDLLLSDGNERVSIRRYFNNDKDKQAYINDLKGMKKSHD